MRCTAKAYLTHLDWLISSAGNEQGYLLSKSEQRKLENIFLRDDYPRHADGELGELSFVPGLSDRYLDALAKTYQQLVEPSR